MNGPFLYVAAIMGALTAVLLFAAGLYSLAKDPPRKGAGYAVLNFVIHAVLIVVGALAVLGILEIIQPRDLGL